MLSTEFTSSKQRLSNRESGSYSSDSSSDLLTRKSSETKSFKSLWAEKPIGNRAMLYMSGALLLSYILLSIIAPLTRGSCNDDADGPVFVNDKGWKVDEDGKHCFLINRDESLIGVICGIGMLVYGLENSGFWMTSLFFKIIPSLTCCYFLPGLLYTASVFDSHASSLPSVATKYLLTFSLLAFCTGADIKQLCSLGWRAVVVFLAGTLGVMLGGLLSVLTFAYAHPPSVCDDETWRGLAYLAGSWIGGGANATAMATIFATGGEALSIVVTVDTVGGMLVMILLLTGVGYNDKINAWTKCDSSSIDKIIDRMEFIEKNNAIIPSSFQTFTIVFGGMLLVGIANAIGWVAADGIESLDIEVLNSMAFNNQTFWRVMIATIIGFSLSFTGLRKVELWGCSKLASTALQFLILTIGMGMDISLVAENPMLFLLGVEWLLVHILVIFTVGWALKVPYFYVAVGSQANIGAAASAPIVAAAFNPVLAPVGALMGIFGYVVGTWCAWATTLGMREIVYSVCDDVVMRGI